MTQSHIRYPLKQVITACAEDHLKEFPKNDRFAIISTEEPLYTSPQTKKELAKYELPLEQIIIKARAVLKRNPAGAQAYPDYTINNETTLQLVIINDNYVPNPIEQAFNFFHEMGHLYVPNGMAGGNIGESAAEAYGTILHQKYVGPTNFFDFYPYQQAHNVIGGSKIHYTSSALFAAEKFTSLIDPRILSLEDITKVAACIAEHYSLAPQILDKITHAYQNPPKRLRNIFSRAKNSTAHKIKTVLNVMEKYKDDDDIYRAGRLLLSEPHLVAYIEKQTPLKEKLASFEGHEKETGFILNPVDAMDAKLGFSPIRDLIESHIHKLYSHKRNNPSP